jgi:hypothetical protein
MERIALKCIARLNKQFAAHELINEIKAAGYGFVGNAEVRSRRFCAKWLRITTLTSFNRAMVAGQQSTKEEI